MREKSAESAYSPSLIIGGRHIEASIYLMSSNDISTLAQHNEKREEYLCPCAPIGIIATNYNRYSTVPAWGKGVTDNTMHRDLESGPSIVCRGCALVAALFANEKQTRHSCQAALLACVLWLS